MKILIVDDEADIRGLVKLYLENEHYELVEAVDGLDAVDKLDDSIDLILLDIMMPRMNGLQACAEIRKKYNTPIIFLTAKGEDMDKYTGFTSGGDDYIIKPFNPIDLTSRVKAHIRRYRTYNEVKQNVGEIILGDLVINLAGKTLHKNNEFIKLTKIEFSILELFLTHRKQVFSLDQIYGAVWGEESVLNAESTVSVHIRNLRNKIEDDIREPKYIKTVWGCGYRVD
ncbi:MAG: DNA-binding response regulator [Epulopiscium sp. Nuni2H_MBin001]|nr:MAG: DNA-binding response regulator [Epulopiscium sp. Nuni2H_MBin001]